MKDAPSAPEFAGSQREGDERAVFDFFPGDPEGEDADADAKLHELLRGLHAAKLNDGVEHHLFAAKILFDEPEGEAVFAVEDVVLARNLGTFHAARLRPR